MSLNVEYNKIEETSNVILSVLSAAHEILPKISRRKKDPPVEEQC